MSSKNSDVKLIFEAYNFGAHKNTIELVRDLFKQKKQEYPGAGDEDLFDSSVEDLVSQARASGDEDVVSVLGSLKLQDVLSEEAPEQPNGWTGEGFEELSLADLTDELLRFDQALPEEVKQSPDYQELLYNIKRSLKQYVDELEIKLNGQ